MLIELEFGDTLEVSGVTRKQGELMMYRCCGDEQARIRDEHALSAQFAAQPGEAPHDSLVEGQDFYQAEELPEATFALSRVGTEVDTFVHLPECAIADSEPFRPERLEQLGR
jgi:hypothetical protein